MLERTYLLSTPTAHTNEEDCVGGLTCVYFKNGQCEVARCISCDRSEEPDHARVFLSGDENDFQKDIERFKTARGNASVFNWSGGPVSVCHGFQGILLSQGFDVCASRVNPPDFPEGADKRADRLPALVVRCADRRELRAEGRWAGA